MAPHLPQKLRHVSGEDQWCFNVSPGLAFGSEAAWLNDRGLTFCSEDEDDSSMKGRALALNMFAAGIKAKGTSETPVVSRQERHAQKDAGYLVGSEGMWRGASVVG